MSSAYPTGRRARTASPGADEPDRPAHLAAAARSQSLTKRSIENRSSAVRRPAAPISLARPAVLQQRAHGRHQPSGVGGREPVHAVIDDGRQLGGGQADHRHAHRHRLAQGQAEARVAHGVEVEPVGGHGVRQLGRGHLAEAAELGRAHAHEVEGHLVTSGQEHVEAEAAPACRQAVHHRDAPLEVAGPAGVVGDHDAVLDHPGRRGPAVPHQVVERGDVDDERVGVVDRVPRVGRRLPGRVVLDDDLGHGPLGGGQDLVPIDQPVLVGLVDHGVDGDVPEVLHGHLSHRVGPREGARPAAVAVGPTRPDRQDDLVRDVREVPEVVAVDVPGQQAQGAGHRSSRVVAPVAARGASGRGPPAAPRRHRPRRGPWASARPARRGPRRGGAPGRAAPTARGRPRRGTRRRSALARRPPGGRPPCRCSRRAGRPRTPRRGSARSSRRRGRRRERSWRRRPGAVSGASAAEPVSTTRHPAAASRSPTAAKSAAGHRLSFREAPGWMHT